MNQPFLRFARPAIDEATIAAVSEVLRQNLGLPLFSAIQDSDVERVVAAVKSAIYPQ